MKTPCPKCTSKNTYSDGGEMACLMCGKRWPINGAKPIIVYKRSEDENMESKKTPSGKVGPCANCGRSKFIAGADGLCSACHYSVKDTITNSPEYHAALAKAKERLTDPNNKRCAKVKTKASPRVKSAKPDPSAARAEASDRIHNDLDVIKSLTEWRDWHHRQADKYDQAITLLS